MKPLLTVLLIVLVAGCGGGTNTVLQDFGIQKRPDDYVSGEDKVFERLGNVGKTELVRLNKDAARGEVKFEDGGPLRGKYYKEVKVYENYYPLEAQSSSSGRAGPNKQRGYAGFIEYAYRIYQSPRKNSRTEANALTADIPTPERGRETYRYRFNSSGTWLGGKGEAVRR